MNKTQAVYQMAQDYADEKDIPWRKALNWFHPYDYEARKDFISGLPEYEVVELEIGGIIAVEDKNG